jgi:very-short-patch-repair endonuclease
VPQQIFSSPHGGEEGAQTKFGKVRGSNCAKIDSQSNQIFDLIMQTTDAQARALRKRQTDAEAILWSRLRNRQLEGFKFRRQVPLLGYIADFVSHDAKLIIELDGGQHAEQVEADQKRTRDLEAAGFLVLRFWNADIFTNLDGVLTTIHATLRPAEYTVL